MNDLPKDRRTPIEIEKISHRLKSESIFLFVLGLFFLLPVFLLSVYHVAGSDRRQSFDFSLPIIGMLFICLGVFEFKLALDFSKLKSWAYDWVEFIAKYTRTGRSIEKYFFCEEVRKAFRRSDPPKPEYPDFPEYGPKYEDTEKKN